MNKQAKRIFTVFAITSTLASSALAGTLQLRDDASVFSATDRASLTQAVAMYPFDVRVLSSNTFADRGTFDQYVATNVASPNMVVVGIAPTLRRTSVHFGVSTRIAPTQWRTIESQGAPFFRTGQWAGGVQAILTNASGAVGSGPANMPLVAQNTRYPVAPYGTPTQNYRYNRANRYSSDRGDSSRSFGFVWVVLGVAVGAMVLVAIARRAARNGGQMAGGYRTNGYPGGQPGGYPYAPPGGPGGYGYGPSGGGISPMGAGIAGAAVGGIAGYALGRAMDDHGGSYTHTSYDNGPSYDNSPSYDAGGSSSGWDGGGGGSDGGGSDW
ncbi:MAG: TPM domain-containing protein [Deltaproteobacteria bacterium]|nr:TPM domain-containing protein [Deltaproteobacteria bacterium]